MPWWNNCMHTSHRATEQFPPSFWTLHFSDTFLLSFSVLLQFVWGLELNAKFTMNPPAWVRVRKQKCQKTAKLMFWCNLVHHETCFHLNSALEMSCPTPVLQRFLAVLEDEVENLRKGPCYSSVLKKLEIPLIRFSSSMKPSQVALLAPPSCCECCSTGSNCRKIEQVPGSLRSWADMWKLVLYIHLVYLQNLSKLVIQKDSCLYLHALLLSTENTGYLIFCFCHMIVKYSNK